VIPMATARGGRPVGPLIAQIAIWVIVAAPAVYQLGLLATAISGRFAYSYDLEWMEGGLLHHAQRISDGNGIYVPPSVDFIPYLYTPLYPTLIALFGVSYQVGRALSVLALFGIGVVALISLAGRRHVHLRRGPAIAGAVLALGLFAAVYPYVEGWYDLVRADTLFLFMVTAGLAALPAWARTGKGATGHARVAAGAAILALAFYCKQTGVIYVALGGAVVLAVGFRRVPVYVVTAAVVGLGGTAILNVRTDGWFWVYVSKIHRAHDFNMDRFWKSFGNILLHFPAMTFVVVAALVAVAVTTIVEWRARRTPVYIRQAEPLLLWSAAFAVSTVVGAVGWGTEFAHFNAYMPAFLHGALAAGAALPAIYACAWRWWGERPHLEIFASGVTVAFALPLVITCFTHTWSPEKFVPAYRDEAAGDALIARIRAIDGEVWMPSHPWYLHLAGKTPRVHRMGIKDVTVRQPRVVEGLDDVLNRHRFAALILDERDVHLYGEVAAVPRNYRIAWKLPENERPRLFTGAKIRPESIWLPAVPSKPPSGARVLYDFEGSTWQGWQRSGPAWGNAPVTAALPGQGLVLGATGTRFATSMHGGDGMIGRITSPEIVLDMAKITAKVGGGADEHKLYLMIVVDNAPVAKVSVPEPGGGTLREVVLEIPDTARGKTGRLVLVDESPSGHLAIDDVWAFGD
jgi:hypothetical protein